MWDTMVRNATCDWEPLELRLLKKELAQLDCKCSACATSKETSHPKQEGVQVDAAIQVEKLHGPFDRYIYSNCNLPEKKLYINTDEYLHNGNFCPNCYFIWDLLRGIKRILKDEQSEARPNMFTSDKATGRDVQFVDSTTSVTGKPTTKHPSDLSLCDYLWKSLSNMTMNSQVKTKSNQDRVKFSQDSTSCMKKDDPKTCMKRGDCKTCMKKVDSKTCMKKGDSKTRMQTVNSKTCMKKVNSKTSMKNEQKFLHGTCYCLDNFIDSIRPPLNAI